MQMPPSARDAARQARALDARFRVIFECVNDGILVIAADTYEFIDANPQICSMFGYTHEEMLKLDSATLSADRQPLNIAKRDQYRDRAQAGEALVLEWRCRAKDGLLFWTEIAVRLASFEGRQVLLLTAHDISQRHQAQMDLAYTDHVIHAVTAAIADLVTVTSLPIAMSQALLAVGEALDVDRLMVFEGNSVTRSLSDAISFSWTKSAELAAFGPHVPDADGAGQLAEWLAPLTRGETVISYAGAATGIVADMMRTMGTRSILMVPIAVNGAYWGHIAADDCREPRAWTTHEIDAVGIFARVVGSVMTQRRTETALAQSEEQFRTVSDTVLDAILMVDPDGRVAYSNHAAERILGYTTAEMAGASILDSLVPPRLRGLVRREMKSSVDAGDGPWFGTNERAVVRKDGVEISVELSINPLSLGTKRYAVGVLRDITSRKATEAALETMAWNDTLTGLPNRRYFIGALNHEIARSKRSGENFAVLYLDLDLFKDVNDTLGHPVGDRLLQAVAERLRASVRESDIISRFGGDEFAAISIDTASADGVASLATKIVTALAAPFEIDHNAIQSGASVGVAVYGPESPDAESLLSHADVALYRAKADQRGTYRFYTQAMDAEVHARVAINAELTAAIAEQQFVIFYQPQVSVETGRIAGVEALVRWQHPTRGLLGPDVFIAAAEHSGIIVPLGRLVKREACLQMRRWVDAGIAPPLVGVNVSGVQFKAPRALTNGIAAILKESAIAPHSLELELTESVLLEASLEHATVLGELRTMGLRVAIDDFGTGYSSLDYLRRFHVDRLKIPRTFIVDVCHDASLAAIVRATIGLARELDIEVVVEGVETAEQVALLYGWGCRVIQGFYYSPPLDVAGITQLLRAGVVAPAHSA